MPNLQTTFAGIRMRNPIGVAAMLSLTGIGRRPRVYADNLLQYVERGAGYVYTAGTSIERESPLERLKASSRVVKGGIPGVDERMGTFTACDPYIFLHRMDNTLEVIRILKEQLPADVPIIGDLIGPGDNVEGWVEGAKLMEQAGVRLLEMDTSCPFPAGGVGGERRAMEHVVVPIDEEAESELAGLGIMPLLGDSPRVLARIIEAIVQAVNIPVGFKMTGETGFPRNVVIMKAGAKAGAKFIVSLNGIITLAPPDIYNRGKPIYPYLDINPFGGAAGAWLRPTLLKNIGAGCLYVPEVDHGAVGGIVDPRQVVEYLMLGAKHIGLASAICITEGAGAITRFIRFLERFMEEQGYENVDDLIGIAREYVQPVTEKTDWGGGRIGARVDQSICTECGRCLDGYCLGGVISKNAKGQITINEETCGACGYCIVICPEDAITLVERAQPSSPVVEWP